MSQSGPEPKQLTELTAEITAAYFRGNPTPPREVPALIAAVAEALRKAGTPSQVEAPPAPTPAVPIKKSITPEHLISLEDGRPYRSLRRHLASRGLTPDAYRAKWGLPDSYPMVAPAYSERRSELAKRLGLGQMRRKAPPPTPPAKARRGRRPKAETA